MRRDDGMRDALKEALAEYVEEEYIRIANNKDYIIETSAEFDEYINRIIYQFYCKNKSKNNCKNNCNNSM